MHVNARIQLAVIKAVTLPLLSVGVLAIAPAARGAFSISNQPAGVAAFTNSTVNLKVSTAGSGNPNSPAGLRWYFNASSSNGLIAPANLLTIAPPYSSATGSASAQGTTYWTNTLTISPAGIANGGYYIVVLTNGTTSVTSAVAAVTILANQAGAMSVQLIPGHWSSGITRQPLLPSDYTGAFPASNWNALTIDFPGDYTSWTSQTFSLVDQNGIATSSKLTVLGVSDGWRDSDPPPDSAPITKLLNTFVKTASPYSSTLGKGLMQFTFTNLNNSQTYNAYVYTEGDSAALANVHVEGTSVINYVIEKSAVTSNTIFTASVSTNSGAGDSGNYVHLKNISPVSGAITISIDAETGTPGAYGISGLQLLLSSQDQVPPVIARQPASQTVYTNVPGIFSVVAAGEALNYQWYSVIGGVTNAISGATNSTYTTAPGTLAMSGNKYYVMIVNPAGTVKSSQATLTVVSGVATVMSAQLHRIGSGTFQPLGASEPTGAFSATNWNPLSVEVPGDGASWIDHDFALNDRNGIGSGVHLIVRGASDGASLGDPPPDSAPITKLLNTFVKTSYRPDQNGPNVLGGGMMQLILTNLDNSQQYGLYMYLVDDWGKGADVDAGTGVTNYLTLWSSVNQSSNFVAASSTDPNTHAPANYVHFTGITPANGAIIITVNYYDPSYQGYGAGVAGIQLLKSSADIATPTITKQPSSQTVYTNVSITFSAGAVGSPTPTVQWFQVIGGVTNPVGGATSSSYTTPQTTLSMSGTKFFAVFSNSQGTATTAQATLTVVAGRADVLGLQLHGHLYTSAATFQSLVPGETAGAFASSNWNVVLVEGGADPTIPQNFLNMKDANGIGTAIQVSTLGINDDYQAANPPPDAAPITKLLNTFIETDSTSHSGSGMMSVTFANLDNAQYNAYVYVLADPVYGGGTLESMDAGNGIIKYPGFLFTSVNSSSNFVESVNSDPNGPYDRGNYVHLTGIIPSSGSITITISEMPGNTGYGPNVSGIQVVRASVDKAPISITVQPVSQRVITNTPATFSVVFLGYPYTLQWYAITGGATNVIGGATNHYYTTVPVTDAMTGTGYFVVVSNEFGAVASQVAVLTAGHMVSPAPGLLELDQYNGAILSDLLDATYLASHTPDLVRWVSSFESPGDLPDHSGERFFGWFTPPVTTNYIFFVASDDESLLLLSTNATADGKCQIAEETVWSSANQWTSSGGGSILAQKRSDQFVYDGSLPGGMWPGGNTIHLMAGTPYYIELNHAQGGGGQDASVTYVFAGEPDPANGTATVLSAEQLSTQRAPDYILPAPQPHITDTTGSGGNLTITGINGLANATYYVLSSTNASVPLTGWTMIATQRFNASGNFSYTTPITPIFPQRFFILQVP